MSIFFLKDFFNNFFINFLIYLILLYFYIDNPFVKDIIVSSNKNNNFCSFRNKSEYNSYMNKKEKVVYIFNILKSRKKEKKYLRKKYNKIISRVHNMDCLLKKIKA